VSTASGPARPGQILTPRTITLIAVLVALTALFGWLSSLMYADALSDAAYAAAYWYGTGLQVVFAVVIVLVALGIGLHQHVGKQWLFVGLGVVAYALGDITWTILDLHMGLDPYPSIADIFYTLEYVFFFAAIVLAIRSYRALTSLRGPVVFGLLVGGVAAAVIYLSLLRPYILPAGAEELGLWGLVVSTLYPVGDVFLMLAPAVTLAIVIMRLGAGRLAWPWWLVVVGAFVFSLTDSFYSYVDWAGTGSNVFLDMGWMVANLIFAVAALVARNIYRPS